MLFAERRQVLPDGYKEFLLPLEYIDFAFPFRCISLYCMLLGIFYPVVRVFFLWITILASIQTRR